MANEFFAVKQGATQGSGWKRFKNNNDNGQEDYFWSVFKRQPFLKTPSEVYEAVWLTSALVSFSTWETQRG